MNNNRKIEFNRQILEKLSDEDDQLESKLPQDIEPKLKESQDLCEKSVPPVEVLNNRFPDNTPLPPNANAEVRHMWIWFLSNSKDPLSAHEAIDAFTFYGLSIPPELGKWISWYQECWVEKYKKPLDEMKSELTLDIKLNEMAHATKVLGLPVEDAAAYATDLCDIFPNSEKYSKDTLKEYYRKSKGKKARKEAEKDRLHRTQESIEREKQRVWDFILRESNE